jgi:cytochrome c
MKYLVFVSVLFLAACGGPAESSAPGSAASGGAAGPASLTAFELEHGIGPVTEVVELGEIDAAKVALGKDVYQMKCESCHRMDARLVGPALGDVLDNRSAAFVMNIILNPTEMLDRHPEGKKMLAQYMVQMPYQNVSKEEARAIVEYLRTVDGN